MAKVIFSTTWQLSLGETGVTSSDPHTNWATSSDPSALAELWLPICGRPQVWYHSGLSESSRCPTSQFANKKSCFVKAQRCW